MSVRSTNAAPVQLLVRAIWAVCCSGLNRKVRAFDPNGGEVPASDSDDIGVARGGVGRFAEIGLQVVKLDRAVFAELDRFPVAKADSAVEAAFVKLPVEDAVGGSVWPRERA